MHVSSTVESSIAEPRDHPPPNPRAPGLWATHAIRASDLQAKTFEPLRYVVPGLIPEGVSLLVGRPKPGKSWLMLDLCIAIADGRSALGALPPAAGDVRYLALEDGERRLQRRMATLLPNANAWPSRLTLATRGKRAAEGGLADIRDWRQWWKGRRRWSSTRSRNSAACPALTASVRPPTTPSCSCKKSPPSAAWPSSWYIISERRAPATSSTRYRGPQASPAPPTRS